MKPSLPGQVSDIVMLEYPMKNIQTSHTLEFLTEEGEKQVLQLRGIAYHGGYHFISCIISAEQDIWSYNGINTGTICAKDGIVGNQTDNQLRACRGRDLVPAFYTLKHQ